MDVMQTYTGKQQGDFISTPPMIHAEERNRLNHTLATQRYVHKFIAFQTYSSCCHPPDWLNLQITTGNSSEYC